MAGYRNGRSGGQSRSSRQFERDFGSDEAPDFGPRRRSSAKSRRRPGAKRRHASPNGSRRDQANQLRRMADQIDPPQFYNDAREGARYDPDIGYGTRIGRRL